MPHVFIPPTMRTLTDGQSIIEVKGTTVREVLDDLDSQFPGCKQIICEGDSLRTGLTVAVGGTVCPLGLRQRVNEDAEIHFLPAVGGG